MRHHSWPPPVRVLLVLLLALACSSVGVRAGQGEPAPRPARRRQEEAVGKFAPFRESRTGLKRHGSAGRGNHGGGGGGGGGNPHSAAGERAPRLRGNLPPALAARLAAAEAAAANASVKFVDSDASSHAALPVFVHIPKTGGRRLTELLTAEYGQATPAMYTEGLLDRMRRGGVEVSLTRYFYVHFDDKGVPALLDFLREETAKRELPSPRILTMLRDPVQRIVSEFYSYHDLMGHNPKHRKQACSPGSLEAYLKDPCSWDRQVRYLVGQGGQATSGVPGADAAMVQDALQYLRDNNALIASTDCFSESVQRIGTELHWTTLDQYDPQPGRVKEVFSTLANHNVSRAEWYSGGEYMRELARNATVYDRMLLDAVQPLCKGPGDAATHWRRRGRRRQLL